MLQTLLPERFSQLSDYETDQRIRAVRDRLGSRRELSVLLPELEDAAAIGLGDLPQAQAGAFDVEVLDPAGRARIEIAHPREVDQPPALDLHGRIFRDARHGAILEDWC